MLLNTRIIRDYLAADVTYNNTAALADTLLSCDVLASGKYLIEAVLHGTNAVRSLNFDFGGTATITNFIGTWKSFEPGSVTLAATRVTAVGTDYNNSALDAGDEYYEFKGSVEINAAGTFLLRAAQRSADVSNTVLKRGSSLVLMKIPSA